MFWLSLPGLQNNVSEKLLVPTLTAEARRARGRGDQLPALAAARFTRHDYLRDPAPAVTRGGWGGHRRRRRRRRGAGLGDDCSLVSVVVRPCVVG
jgi:hypothetical protein